MSQSAKSIEVDLQANPYRYLLPADLARSEVEYLGVVTRGSGERGALLLVKATGRLVQVNAGVWRSLDQRKAQAALDQSAAPR